jgi:hypothetical protein
MTNQHLLNLFNNEPQTFWRVDWYGYLQTADQDGEKYAAPYVELYLSKVQSAGNFDFNSKVTTDYNNQLKINVPIEWLCALRIGDLLNRKSVVRTGDQNHRIEDFRDVNINKNSVQHVAAGAKSPNGEHYLPAVHHPYHLKATKTRCAIVTLSPSRKLVIPHYVILQTYFSSCSYAFRQLFQHGLSLDSLYEAGASFLEDNGRAFIHLKQRVHDVAAPEIARIAFDIDAQQAALKVSRSLAIQTNNEEDLLFPTTQFPFTGHTNLKVYGKWCGSESLRTFVVFGILSCSSAFPFQFLNFFRDAPGDKNPDEEDPTPGGKGSGWAQKPRKKRPVGNNGIDPQLTETPDSEFFTLDVKLESRTIFHGLKEPEKLRVAPFKPKTGSKPPIDTKNVDTGNTGEGKRDGQGVPLSFSRNSDRQHTDPDDGKTVFSFKIDRLSLFDEVCVQLESMPRIINLQFRLAKEPLGDHYARFPHVTNENGITLNWPYSNYVKGVPFKKGQKKELRKVAIAEIELISHTIYVFEAERRVQSRQNGWVELDQPALFIAQTQSREKLSNYQLESLLRRCAQDRGIWSVNDAQSSFECFLAKHPDNDTFKNNTYTDKFIDLIQKKLGYSFDQ